MQLHTALLWFDNSPRIAFIDKVTEAISAYEERFGRSPDVCYVNPGDLPQTLTPPTGVTVEAEPSVLKHHFYIGLTGC